MARGFRMGVGGGGSLKPNPIIISGSIINYNHDSTLVSGNDSVDFSYPNQPFIYDLDMTKFNTLTIVSRNPYGNGSRLYFQISGSSQDYREYPNTNWQTFTIDISNMTGLHSIMLINNATTTIYIKSMVMS